MINDELADYGEKSKELIKQIEARFVCSDDFLSLIVRFGIAHYLDGYYDCRTEIRGGAL